MKQKKARKKKDKKGRDRKRGAPSSADAIATAREGVTRAGQKLADRVARLESVADGIETAAVDRFVTTAVGELAEERLLRDIADLQSAFTSRPPGGLPEDIEPFRLLPEAILRWLRSRFDLAPYLEAGKVLQVPGDKLAGFEIEGERAAAPPGALVRLKIRAPGWKRGSEVVVPPRAEAVP